MATTTFALLLALVVATPSALAQLNSTQQAEASALINQAINSTNSTRPWYETWTPNAPAYLTYNATLPEIWMTGVMGSALRTSMSILVRDSIQYSQVRTGLWVNYTINNVSISPWVQNQVSFGMGITPLSTANYNASMNVTGRGPVLEFPIALNTISLFHSVPGVNIRLDGPTAAAIFQNQIQYWNDPKISACTGISVAQLPNQRINLAVRADPSALTSYVAQYFNMTYFPEWTLGVNNTLNWTQWAAFAGNGSTEMQNYMAKTPYAITYLDSWSGNNASNSAGTFWEVPLKNFAGNYQTSTNAAYDSLAAVLPRPPRRWNNVNLINLPDNNVFPILYGQYVYVNGELRINGTTGGAIKQVLGFWLSDQVQGTMVRNYRAIPLNEQMLAASARYWNAINATIYDNTTVGWPQVSSKYINSA